ncbi:MAG: RNA methyltransferase [Lachnospiraceae bacterium]|nr:RNA methyltransferase [Lachnospiraceae bacterium]
MANIIEITDFNAPELDIYARLSENQLLHYHEPIKKGLFIAESPKVIERALNAGCVPVSMLLERKHIIGEARDIIARCGHIPVYTADSDVLTQLTGFQLTRGTLAAMYRPALPTVEEICRGARRVAVLENVMNPTNVGAIFRSAAALNMDAVLLTPACSDPLYRRAIRVSMGTVFQIPWTFLDCTCNEHTKAPVTATASAPSTTSEQETTYLQPLKDLGFRTAAMALSDDSISIDDPRLNAEEKLAIVLGTEGDGLASSTIADCDYTVRIPMTHGVDSLNVAAASAVAFWQLGKK